MKLGERSRLMKILVDELPNFYEDCPFSKEKWINEEWKGFCTLVNERCNIYRCETECLGLKELKNGADQ